jgi:6,7-dimethyl-8-ribityllumazine synthase
VSQETGIPIANGILTVDTDEQAMARTADKGRDCARAAVELANLLSALEPESDEDDEEEEEDE